MTFSKKIISFLKKLDLQVLLPDGIAVMNPYTNPELMKIVTTFYNKYYNDFNERYLILGINPGRFGAGVTGIPFTDTKRLSEICGITFNSKITHEPSSVFIYHVIKEFGGAEKFYSRFYIGAVCPLGFVKLNEGKPINYNYYEQKDIREAVYRVYFIRIKDSVKFWD